MQWLVALGQETVGLGILADGQHVYIAQAESPEELRWVVRIGVPVPLHMGAGPRVLLAYLPGRERDAIIRKLVFDDVGPSAPKNEDELRDVLSEIRRTGTSLARGERMAHSVAMAVPLLGKGERPVGTLVLGGAEVRLTSQVLDAIREPMLAASRELSRQLGYTGMLP